MKQPFYLKLDKVLTCISVVKTTKTNLLVETEYRKLLANGKLQIAGAAKPRSGESLVDGYFEINGEAKLFKNSNFIFDITAVSDSGFLGRYGYSDTDRLTSKISLNAQGDRNFSEISATYFTSFRDNSQNEYIVAPNFFTRYYRNIHPLDLSLVLKLIY